MTTTPDPLKLARDAQSAMPLPALWLAWNTSYTGIRFWTADAAVAEVQAATGLALTGFYSAEQMRAAIDALPATKAFPLETVTRLPAERVAELFSRWAAARQQHPAPRGGALCMNEEFLLCLDAFDRRASVPSGEPADTGWLQDRGLLYRLTDERQRRTATKEIRVTMADGSRSDDACTRRAGELLDRINATTQAAPAPAAVPAGWRMEAMAPYGYAVHAPSGAACIVCELDDSPRIVPTVVLAELCGDLLAARTQAPAVAPLLVRDLAASVKAQPLDVSKVLESLGYGKHSINMAVPADAIGAVETYFAARTQAQAAPAVAAAEPLRVAAQAVLDRWCSEKWEWARQGPTADLIQALADALAGKSAPVVAAPEPRTLTEAQIERHSMPASECPPDSAVMLVSSIRRLLGMAAAPTTQEPQ